MKKVCQVEQPEFAATIAVATPKPNNDYAQLVLDPIIQDSHPYHNGYSELEMSEAGSHWSGQTNKGNTWDVYLGDALTVLKNLPGNAFQCIITSPPYYWLRDYGVEGQLGKEQTINAYVEAITNVMEEVRRVLVSDG